MPAHPCHPRLLAWTDSPEEVAARLRGCPGFVWLDTAGHRPGQDADGGLSLLTAFPSQVFTGSIANPAPLEKALETLRPESSRAGSDAADWGFPTAGLFGGIDYEGAYTFGLYPEVLAYRHASRQWFATGPRLPALAASGEDPNSNLHPIPEPAIPGPENPHFQNETTPEHYQNLVARAQAYIAAGDIYQVNLAHRFTAPWPAGADAFPLALRLRAASPAPYAAFMDLGGRQILSSSPESFLKISGRHIRTRPIKGTRPRFRDSAADERSAIELMRSEKERAELLMITDLLRNDLGQVCEFGSVRVTDLLKLEPFEQVFHLVSTIEGRLRDNISPVAAMAACFPGGSITGAPKKRAMEIIAELEAAPRGLYTGAIGYFGANGESQFNIAIRTIVIQDHTASFQVGAGIVADSKPESEWLETLHKAAGIFAAAALPTATPPRRITSPGTAPHTAFQAGNA